jgi:hypothetical protein
VKEPLANRGDADQTVSIEQQVLRAICCAVFPPSELNRVIEKLANYSWLEPEHTTVFQAIRSVAGATHTSWRDELPAQATRMGFPDVDWKHYLARTSQDGRALSSLIDRLVGDSPKR